ncbi:MAG: type II toxin-antitoxin system RelE/ParE family toxin [Peptococcaceae bacterium]|jgi:mRNA interferase RelE/StbE|nr:type II toxin-antitoxin system RelE/ParE family toxin [Peptococcaceae bacterium]
MSKFWQIDFTAAAAKDRRELDGSVRKQVDKAIYKVAKNPLPKSEGGYGEPLGSKHGKNLTGLLKIKLTKLGIRVVYKLVREGGIMKIIVVAARADDEVYEIADSRKERE